METFDRCICRHCSRVTSSRNIDLPDSYRADKFKLAGDSPIGGSLQATAVTTDHTGKLGLTYVSATICFGNWTLSNFHSLNPGRIDPNNTAWQDSRKPLAAVWESILPGSTGKRFFTVNLHLISKDGSTTAQGNARPPVNLGIQERTSQVESVAVSPQSCASVRMPLNTRTTTGIRQFHSQERQERKYNRWRRLQRVCHGTIRFRFLR